jgi:hypothetical protein
VGVLGTVSAAAAKVISIIENYQYYFIDYLVVVFFLFLILIPLRFVRKTKPTVLNKSDIKGYLITKRHLIIKLKGWKGFTLIVKHNLKYFSEDGVKTIKQFLEV